MWISLFESASWPALLCAPVIERALALQHTGALTIIFELPQPGLALMQQSEQNHGLGPV